jgi:hypothetical protein
MKENNLKEFVINNILFLWFQESFQTKNSDVERENLMHNLSHTRADVCDSLKIVFHGPANIF